MKGELGTSSCTSPPLLWTGGGTWVTAEGRAGSTAYHRDGSVKKRQEEVNLMILAFRHIVLLRPQLLCY